MFEKLLTAIRNGITVRVMATADKLGIETVDIYSDTNRDSGHVKCADESAASDDTCVLEATTMEYNVVAAIGRSFESVPVSEGDSADMRGSLITLE